MRFSVFVEAVSLFAGSGSGQVVRARRTLFGLATTLFLFFGFGPGVMDEVIGGMSCIIGAIVAVASGDDDWLTQMNRVDACLTASVNFSRFWVTLLAGDGLWALLSVWVVCWIFFIQIKLVCVVASKVWGGGGS